MVTNSLEKIVSKYECKKCDFKCSHNCDWLRHLSTIKHVTKNEIIPNYECIFCQYKTTRRVDYDKHLLTSKHKKTINFAEKTIIVTEKTKNIENNKVKKIYDCICGKEYKHKQNLYVHKKKCIVLNENKTDLVLELLKQNQEFQKMLLEQNNKMIELSSNCQVINNTTNNTMNNKFNLNVFLNETCKDALNINDFVNSLQISLSDTERVGTDGFVEGISRIFLNGLKQLDVCKRPIHCSDLKRETMHVKDNNIWIKEEEDTPKIVNAVKLIACKNVKSIPEWKNAYPECRDSESKKSDQYLQILQQSLGACDKEKDQESYLKVAKKIAKATIIPRGIGQ